MNFILYVLLDSDVRKTWVDLIQEKSKCMYFDNSSSDISLQRETETDENVTSSKGRGTSSSWCESPFPLDEVQGVYIEEGGGDPSKS